MSGIPWADCSRTVATVSTISGEKEQPVLIAAIGKWARQQLDLFTHILRVDRLDSQNFSRHFSDHAGHRGYSENAQRAERFQVGLQTRPGAAIGPRDGEGDRR